MRMSSLTCRLAACMLLIVALTRGSAHAAGDPVLYFSDITSGPRTGNSDVSLGQVSGQDGAIVTIWGRNLGAPGTATVLCNGAPAAYIYAHENANRPADLYAYHRMEMISFQISNTAQDGPGVIRVDVSGRQSNVLPFYVRPGNIFYVKTTGSDETGNGTWTNPWRRIIAAKNAIAPGDIVYVCDGVQETAETEYSNACVNLSTDGDPGSPKALVVYPGATAVVGNDSLYFAFRSMADAGGASRHWVLSKFSIRTAGVGVDAEAGFRVVGNWFTAPNGDGNDAAVTIRGDSVVLVGNEMDNVGNPNCDKLYHVIYATGYRTDSPPRAQTESEREIAWNYIHDCQANRAIDVYSEQLYSAFIQGHRIHDNVIMDQHGDGILVGYYVVGENWVYNNLIVRAGLGPAWAGGETSSYTGIRINSGHESVPATVVACYNNTIVACGWSGAIFHEESGLLYVNPEALSRSTTLDFRNNIILSTGEPYLAGASASLGSGSYTNCWYGIGAAPAWDATAINADPLFFDANVNDFRLSAGSPCLDAGQDLSGVVKRDILGTARPQGPSLDLGAYEYELPVGVEPIPYNTGLPAEILLQQNYPNPFNPTTDIRYVIHQFRSVRLAVYDLLGREVAVLVNEKQAPGTYQVRFDASLLAGGTYIYRLQGSSLPQTRKMLLLR